MIQRGDRPIALGYGVSFFILDLEFDRCFRIRFITARLAADTHDSAIECEIFTLRNRRKRRSKGASALQFKSNSRLELLEKGLHLRRTATHAHAHFLGLHHDAARTCGDKDAGAVSDDRRVDMLVTRRFDAASACTLPCGRRMRLDEGERMSGRKLVASSMKRDRFKFREMLSAVVLISIDLEIGYDGSQVGVAVSFVVSVHRTLHHGCPCLYTSQIDCHADARIIVAMNPDGGVGKAFDDGGGGVLERSPASPFVRKARSRRLLCGQHPEWKAIIGVGQNHRKNARHRKRLLPCSLRNCTESSIMERFSRV